jgi:glycosyltransferase involved in cell wall biosynthesis
MRIAQFIDTLSIGGAEKLQVTFMRAAISRGMQPTLITFNCYPEQHYYRELKEMGVEIIEIKGRNLFDPALFRKLVQILRDRNFDVLHNHLTYATILGGMAGWLTGTPVVASIHITAYEYSWRFLEAFVLKFFTNRRIAVGWMVAKTHQAYIIRYPIDVVQNPVEPISKLSEKERLEIRTGITTDLSRLFLVTVGRLTESKGYSDLLDAIDELRRTHPQFLLLIVGAGNFLHEITEKVKSLKLDDHVRLLGLRSDVPSLLAASDIYVSASHREGLSVSVLEAMAAGLPVVATNVGDNPLIIKPEFGICVPAHQPSQIAAALRSLVENPEQRASFGNKAREYAAQYHSSDVWFDQILNIYDQMISARNNIHR